MSHKEIIAANHTRKLHETLYFFGGNNRRDLPLLVDNIEEDVNPGLFGNATHFLDSKYRPFDMLTSDAKQNRLSSLVELLLDKFRKGSLMRI